ncbi:hypothetical protein [Francisella hispaniensis]|nr:hypothetical protein [Francisella hispaniensis]
MAKLQTNTKVEKVISVILELEHSKTILDSKEKNLEVFFKFL